ncbi:unnamed protein product [Owenia fusiformis]|uniref:Uncharacterized protein n=1 Tax=Owenia fusiformis TaxID=6347 RepID=A0A8J1TWM9_OWEFU|nr:unnamed protein product [Owenia fusiformis]
MRVPRLVNRQSNTDFLQTHARTDRKKHETWRLQKLGKPPVKLDSAQLRKRPHTRNVDDINVGDVSKDGTKKDMENDTSNTNFVSRFPDVRRTNEILKQIINYNKRDDQFQRSDRLHVEGVFRKHIRSVFNVTQYRKSHTDLSVSEPSLTTRSIELPHSITVGLARKQLKSQPQTERTSFPMLGRSSTMVRTPHTPRSQRTERTTLNSRETLRLEPIIHTNDKKQKPAKNSKQNRVRFLTVGNNSDDTPKVQHRLKSVNQLPFGYTFTPVPPQTNEMESSYDMNDLHMSGS